MRVEIQRLPKPSQPLFTFGLRQILKLFLWHCAGKDQTIFSTRRGDVKQAHALELFPPTVTFAQFVKERAAHALSATVRHAHSQSLMTIENKGTVPLVGISMQIGNDHHGELETLGLMD